MKFYYAFFGFIMSTVSVFPQSQISSNIAKSTLSQKEGRNLENYIWSRAQYVTGKKDKPLVNFTSIDNWIGLGDYLSVSNDGKYFAYTIEKGSEIQGYYSKLDSLIIQSTVTTWRQSFSDPKPGFFSCDSKHYIFLFKDTLCFLRVGESQPRYVSDVSSYKLPANKKNAWIAYQLKSGKTNLVLQNLITGGEKRFNSISDYAFDNTGEWLICLINSSNYKTRSKELVLLQLATGKEKRFPFVVDYLFAQAGNALIIKKVEQPDEDTSMALQYVSLPTGNIKTIWSTAETTCRVSDYNLDETGKQVAFSIQDSPSSAMENLPTTNVWYYKDGMENAILKVTNKSAGIDPSLEIIGPVSFTENGHYIKFELKSRPIPKRTDSIAVQVTLWSYNDLMLQSAQSDLYSQSKIFNAVININNNQVIQLEKDGQTLYLLQGDFAIVKKNSKETYGDRFWETGYVYNEDSNWLVSLKDGNRRLLPTKGGERTLSFSPRGNYLVYFDPGMGCHYFSINLHNGKLSAISSNVSEGQFGFAYGYPFSLTNEKPEQPFSLAAWLQSDTELLVYDANDIWQLDVTGKKNAVNITNGFGRSHSIIFSLMDSRRFYPNANTPILNEKKPLFLRAFNTATKYNGFYSKVAGATGNPQLLSMGPYFMNIIPWCQDPNLSSKGMQPTKARDVAVWIVQRQSSIEAPNYYETEDFKSFKRLTNYEPQKSYNWLSEELHTFTYLNGSKGQGILFKPENFDSSKKYPVLVVFYGAYSNDLYQFRNPSYIRNAITPGDSPIWFLNNGYLVFTPDIYVTPLKYGPEAFNVIEGAARYLSLLPYVDSNKMACCSHSWSAKLGSYLFTHSKSFSGIAISEGFLYANMLNVALSTDEDGMSHLEVVERGFEFGDLWKNRDSWLDQTTVLNVDKANAPLLLLCNKESSKEYQNQTLQLFTALRRLEKKVWWLKYDKGSHNLSDFDELRDFTIRYTQFFDHYLKEAPAPKWMTQGIPYVLRGIESRYELDPGGRCGTKCHICNKWNEQYKKHPEMFERPLKEWKLGQDTEKGILKN